MKIISKYRFLHIFIAFSFLILFIRFYYFQVHEYLQYEIKAGNNSLRRISIHAPRGIIYDRYGKPLVDNRPIYDLSLIPFDVTNVFNFNLLSNLVELSSTKLKKDIIAKKRSFDRFRPYKIKRHINFETRSRLEENKLDLPGTIFSEFPARTYPSQARLTHVLGYLRVVADEIETDMLTKMNYKAGDVIGFSGLEKMYESILRGEDGAEFRLVDIYGIDHGNYNDNSGIEPSPGNDIFLTIDSKLQSYIENLFKGKKGVVICMDPIKGEILSYLSAPDYDLNSFAGPVPIELWNKWNTDPEKPLLNRGIQGLYPPGSTFKLIASALAIEKDIVSKEWTTNCSGTYHFGDRDFHCWNTAGHGDVNLERAIFQSCNIYFYHLMQKISLDDWQSLSEVFGFGSITGIDLYGEKRGNVPGRLYMNKKYGKYGWAVGNMLTFIIGQGDILVTPLQVVNMMNFIATKGNTKIPHFHINSQIKDSKVSLKSKTWDYLQNATSQVVNHKDGSGKAAKIDGAIIHGKTGTAQNPHGEDHSWFTGYMVIDKVPILSIVVLVEHGGKGSVEAAKISNVIFKYAQKKYSL